MKKKVLILCVLILTNMLLLCSCVKSVQLNERALVQAIGLDVEGDDIVLTLQIFSPSSGSKGDISATAENARIITSKGPTVAFAINNATLVQGKQIFLGHARVLVISEELAREGLEQNLSYFTTNNYTRQNIRLIVSEGSANEILKTKINQGIIPSEMLQKLIENNKRNGFVEDMRLFDFIKSLNNKHESAVLPIIKKISEPQDLESENPIEAAAPQDGKEEEQKKNENIEDVSSIKAEGSAIFVNGKMVEKLKPKETRGLLWIRNEIEETAIKVSDENYQNAAVKIYDAKSKLVPTFDGDKITMTLKVNASGMLTESILREGKEVEYNDLTSLSKSCEDIIRTECDEAFNSAVKENKADIFNFGNLVYKNNVKLWRKIKDDWPSVVGEITFKTDITVKIQRVGVEFKNKQ